MTHINGTTAVLRNGIRMPLLGIGTWRMDKKDAATAVELALDVGYRHIDTAYMYMNEEEIGEGINNWLSKPGSKREDIFVVTKLPATGMTKEGVEKFCNRSLKKLNLDYIDLYLIHYPVGMKGNDDPDDIIPRVNGEIQLDYTTDIIAIWKEMEAMVDLGLTKSIGVASFNLRQLTRINAIARIPPVVNQIEMNVYYQRRDVLEYCSKNGMIVTAFSSLGSVARLKKTAYMGFIPNLLEDPVVKLVADNHNVSAAQILIKFVIAMGAATIPKSINHSRIKSNFEISNLELTSTEMEALKSLDKGEAGRSFSFRHYRGGRLHPEHPDLIWNEFEC